MIRTCQLFSGSSGNSIFISAPSGGILVDIGVSSKRCDEALEEVGVNPDSIEAVFITHEHIDHVRGVRVFAKKHKVPVYADGDIIGEMHSSGMIDINTDIRQMPPVLDFDGIKVDTFKNSHDSTACHGFRFNMPDGKSVSVCTDTGYVTDEARDALKGTDFIYLESNYDENMLLNGSYPYDLKMRIKSKKGHLSNSESNDFAVDLLNGGTFRFVLSHLSRENNTPEKARESFINRMKEENKVEQVDYRLYVSSPTGNGGMIIL